MGKMRVLLSVVVSCILFIGGIALLALRIPFWSLLLGIPAVQIGIVFLIFAFDKLSQEAIKEEFKTYKNQE